MTQHCCVQECRHNNRTSSCTFKKFPNDPQKSRSWENAVRRSAGTRPGAIEWRRSPYDRICECHFDSDQFEIDPEDGHRRLRRSAVPRLFGSKAKVPLQRTGVEEQKGVITKSNSDSVQRDSRRNPIMSSEEGERSPEEGLAPTGEGLTFEQEGIAVEEEDPPVEEEGRPVEEECPSGEEEGLSGDKEGPPVDEGGPPDDEESPPGDEEGPPGDEEGPPGDEEGPPGDEEGPPGDEEGPPGDEEGPLGQEEGISVEYENIRETVEEDSIPIQEEGIKLELGEDNVESKDPSEADPGSYIESGGAFGDQGQMIRQGVSVIASTAEAEAYLYSGASQEMESSFDTETPVQPTLSMVSLSPGDTSRLENIDHEEGDNVLNEESVSDEVLTDGDVHENDQVIPTDEENRDDAAFIEGEVETEVIQNPVNEGDGQVGTLAVNIGGPEHEANNIINKSERDEREAVEDVTCSNEVVEINVPESYLNVGPYEKSCETSKDVNQEENSDDTGGQIEAKELIPTKDTLENPSIVDESGLIEEAEDKHPSDDEKLVEGAPISGDYVDTAGEVIDQEEDDIDANEEEDEEVSEMKEIDAGDAAEGEMLDEGEDFGGEEEEFEDGEEMGDEVEVEIEDCSDSEIEPEGGVTYIISEGMIVVEENEGSEAFQTGEIADATEEEHIVCEDQSGKTTRIVIKVPSSKNTGEAEIPVISDSPSALETASIDAPKPSESCCLPIQALSSLDSSAVVDDQVSYSVDIKGSSEDSNHISHSLMEDSMETDVSQESHLPSSGSHDEPTTTIQSGPASEITQNVQPEALEESKKDVAEGHISTLVDSALNGDSTVQNDKVEVSLTEESSDATLMLTKVDESTSVVESSLSAQNIETTEVNLENVEQSVASSAPKNLNTGGQTSKSSKVSNVKASTQRAPKETKQPSTPVVSVNTQHTDKPSQKHASKQEIKNSKAASHSKSASVQEKGHQESLKEKQVRSGSDTSKHSSKHMHSSSHKHKNQSSKSSADEKSPNTVKTSSNKQETSVKEEQTQKTDTVKKHAEVKEASSRSSTNDGPQSSKGSGGHRTRSNSTSSKDVSSKEKRSSRKEDSPSKKSGSAPPSPDDPSMTRQTSPDSKLSTRSSRSRKLQSDAVPGAKSTEDAVPKKKEKVKISDSPVKPRHSERVSRATEKALASGLVSRRPKPSPVESSEKPQDVVSDDQTSSQRRSKRKAESSPTVSNEDTPVSKRRTRSGEKSSEETHQTSTQSLRSVRKNKLKRKGSSNDEPPLKQAHIDDSTTKEKITDEFIANIPKMCRICGSKNDNLLNVFGPEGRTMLLADKVHSILPIKMRENEPLPSGVCHSCVVTLMACEKLIERSSSLDKDLRAHFDCPEEKTSKDKSTQPIEEPLNVPSPKLNKPSEIEPQISHPSPKCEEASIVSSDETPASTSKSGPSTRSSARVSAKQKQNGSATKSNEKGNTPKLSAVHENNGAVTSNKVKGTPSLDSEDSPPVLEAEPPQSHLPASNEEPSAQPPVLIPQPAKPVPALVLIPPEDASNAAKQRFGNTYRARMKPGQWEKIERGLEAIHGEFHEDDEETGSGDIKPFSEIQTEEFHIVDLDMNVEEVPPEAPADKSAPSEVSSEFRIEIPDENTEEEATAQQSSPKSVIDSILVDWSGDEDDVLPVQKATNVGSTRKVIVVESAQDKGNGSAHANQSASARPNQSGGSSKAPCLFGDDEEAEGAPRSKSKVSVASVATPVVVKQESFWPEPAPGSLTTSAPDKPPSDVPWKCFVCGKRGKSLSKFLEHKKLHLNDRKLVSCPKCSESFSNMSLLRAHMKAHHGDDDEDEVVEQQPRQTRRRTAEKVVDVDLAPATDGLYHCSLCLSAFTSIESLCQHKLTHSKTESSEVYKCTVCRRNFHQHKEFQQHLATHQPSSPLAMFQCAKCDMKMTNQKEFIEHIESHNSDNQNSTCDLCNKVFDSKHKLRSHRSTVHKSTAYACHLCDKVCHKRITLIEHLRKHTGDNPFACPVCNKRFNRLANYKAHMTIHENARRYECPYCGKRFNRQSIQQRHIKTHTSEQSRKHRCRVCNLTFGLATEMFTHRKLHTREEVERATWEDEKQRLALTSFPCKVCQTPFNSVEDVLAHMLIHTDDERDIAAKLKNPRLECDICGKVLNSKRTFNAHRSSHIDGKPFVCKICSKGYSTSTGLNYHMLSHTGERPFPCTFCQKGYKNSTDLKVHMRQHTGEFPYKCNLCNKAFRSASSLQKHGFVHTNHRPFKCQFCNMCFKRENTKLNHERIHTNDRRFKCKVCSRTFIQKGACDAHEKLHFRRNSLTIVSGEGGNQVFDENSENLELTGSSSKIEKRDLFDEFDEEEYDEDDDDDEDEYIIYEDEDGIDDIDAEDEDLTSDLHDGQTGTFNDPIKASVKSLTKGAFEEASKSSNGVDLPITNITPVPMSLTSDAVPSVGDNSVHITIL